MIENRIKELEANVKALRKHSDSLFFALQSLVIYLKMDNPDDELLVAAFNAIPTEPKNDGSTHDSVLELYLPTLLH